MNNYIYFSIKGFPSIEDAIKGELPTVAMPYRSKKSKETIIEIINNKNTPAHTEVFYLMICIESRGARVTGSSF